MSGGRFATVNEQTFETLTEGKDALTTKHTVKRSINLFREF